MQDLLTERGRRNESRHRRATKEYRKETEGATWKRGKRQEANVG